MKNIEYNNLYNLIYALEDPRRKEGTRHSLPFILITSIMAIMSGSNSISAIAVFTKRHKSSLCNLFKLHKKKRRVPSRKTISRTLAMLDFGKLSDLFNNWAKKYVKINKKEWLALDGKAMKGTVTNSQNEMQNFTNIVSVFAQKRNQALALSKFEKNEGNEIDEVQKLIKMLDLEDVVFTMDALHCQVETIKAIVSTNNNYVIRVKGNQPNLLSQLKKNIESSSAIKKVEKAENNKGRKEKRILSIYNNVKGIDKKWLGVKSIIQIERHRIIKDTKTIKIAYFISNLSSRRSAKLLNKKIRDHWKIESHHYVKDVVLKEDNSKIKKDNSPGNMSVLRSVALNIFSNKGIKSITTAIQETCHNINLLSKWVLE